MINKFKQFENDTINFYTIIDIEGGNIEGVYLFDSKESVDNWIINFVHENFKITEYYEEVENEFDPIELLSFYNERWAPDLEMYFHESTLNPKVVLDKHLELKVNAKKYNI